MRLLGLLIHPVLGELAEGVDAVTQSEETLVDVGSLDKPQPTVISIRSSLAPCQIYQGQLRDINLRIDAMGLILVLNCNLKDSMRAGGSLVSICALLCA
jgi:hypothetical protein